MTIALTPGARALAASPDEATAAPAGPFSPAPPELEPSPELGQDALRIVPPEPSPEPAGIEFAEPEADEQAIAIVEPTPTPAPAPTIEPEVSPTPAFTPVPDRWHGKPTRPGTGLIAMGGLSLGVSALMITTALAGPGWADMDRRTAAILGGASLPVGLISAGLLVGGLKSRKRYNRWADSYQLNPPDSGNGMLVVGAALALGGAAAVAGSAQLALTSSDPSRGDWVLTGFAGAATVAGILVLSGGMVRRSKYAAWKRAGYIQPGPMAFKGGGGLTISGRF